MVPREIHWQNYIEALTAVNFGQMYLNTTIITVSATVGQVLSASLVGFGFARLRAPGRDVLFMLLISTMLLPEQVTMIPQFIIFRSLGLVDTWAPLIGHFLARVGHTNSVDENAARASIEWLGHEADMIVPGHANAFVVAWADDGRSGSTVSA